MSTLIVDHGSQYTHLIKRNCRDLGYDAEIVNSKTGKLSEINITEIKKIILSGGPSSVYANSNGLGEEIAKKVATSEIKVPILGICFGHQLLAHVFGGKVEKGKSAEYGLSRITIDDEDLLLSGIPKEFNAWTSHFDEVNELPKKFIALAHSDSCKYEAMRHETRNIFGLQFHPEVWHTEHGEQILKNFLEL
ncbi:MAG: glutamine-hydrolyzing GMP synthase [Candidatus Micrarchaeota archaeon]|nr:glutamine-hydrolyzing GMP synthase [Candidatus Micrarchaeota archaeon]